MRTKSPPSNIYPFSNFAGRTLRRFVVFSFFWFLLVGLDKASWFIGLPAVLFATALSLKLAPSSQYRTSPAGAMRFIPFFLWQSLLGGLDVMRRAFSSPRLLDPALVSYTTLLPEGSARIFFVNTISLLPGTLSARLQGNKITIHIIAGDQPILDNIQVLEHHVAALMCIATEREKKP
jgi:multicomponent Na+:H+ antiporter subunit E